MLLGWLQKQQQTGAPIDPIARQRIQEHLAVHYQYLQKTNPAGARQLAQTVQQQEQPQPNNVAQMPAAGGPPVQTTPDQVGAL